jgi:hypothetical protein
VATKLFFSSLHPPLAGVVPDVPQKSLHGANGGESPGKLVAAGFSFLHPFIAVLHLMKSFVHAATLPG